MAWISYWIGTSITLAVCCFALIKGDKPERYGACLRLAVSILGIIAYRLFMALGWPQREWAPLLDLASTAIMSFGFLYIALRYGSAWLAVAMMIQGSQFYIDRVFLDADIPSHQSYALQENLITFGVVIVILLATVSSVRRRQKQRAAEALAAQKREARLARIHSLPWNGGPVNDGGTVAA